MLAGMEAMREMLSSAEAPGLGAPWCCILGLQGKMLRVEGLRGKEERILQCRSCLKTQEHLHSQVRYLSSPGSPFPASGCYKAKMPTLFSWIWGCRGSNPHSHCYFLPNFRCGVPKDVDGLCFGWEGGAESAVASLPICSWCPPACGTPACQPARLLAKSWSNPSCKPKWPSTVH